MHRFGHEAAWAEVMTVPDRLGLRGLGPVLNWAARQLADEHDFLTFVGDDHLPHKTSPLWDERLAWSLKGRPGVAYGNDLFQRERLPTMALVDARVVRVLGYLCPRGMEHLWLDDFWKRLGEDLGNLVYLPDVIIEHLHPAAGKAPLDRGYLQKGLNPKVYAADRARYERFLREKWRGENGDLARLKQVLGIR
jgi:hypothetical protein